MNPIANRRPAWYNTENDGRAAAAMGTMTIGRSRERRGI
jgi:hypothetical protein